ncbi:hypothetical protein D4764_14G0004110 [Takifugu flavidus]|uniref:Uncharacterized protein n=1 Tax=Takifugu flavidus TaxID=433684 RepID=A0A5C6P6A0_9TELE|nr:hypothetical protein D4764_14G0004110 [Takifugu flavidus]
MPNRPSRPSQYIWVCWERLAESPVRRSFNSHLWESFDNVPGKAGDIESEWTMFRASIVEAADRCCGRKVVGACRGGNARTRWWAPAVRDAVWLKKESYRALLACGTPEAADRYRQAKRSAATVVAEAKTMGRVRGDGELLTTTWDVVDRWKEYFEDLLNPTNAPSNEEAGPGDLGIGSHISGAEVAEVVKKLLGGKAPGVDEIRPEFLKALEWRSSMVKRELSQKAKLSIYRSIFVPTLTYGHELWVMTERTRSRVQAAKMSFLHRVAGLSLRDRVRSSVIREELGVEPLLLCVERSQMRWLGHLVRIPPGCLPGEVLRACPFGRRPPGRPRTRWRDYVSRLAWERLGIPLDELEEVAGEREVWAS